MRAWTAVLLLACVSYAAADSLSPLLVSAPTPSTAGVYAMLKRTLPANVAPLIEVELSDALAAQYGTTKDTFTLSGGGSEAVKVSGSTLAAITAGVGHYLKYHCNASFAWSGSQMNISLPLPALSAPVTVQAALPWRYYLNTCTHSYTLAFWDWARWEREIDWMALQGINMPLAFTGQEQLWYQLFRQFNVTDAELSTWFTGPAFLAWFRMGNIQTYNGPLSKHWRTAQRDLQLQILPRMRQLGMTAVLPGFAGHVPAGLARAFPDANITRSALWAGFNDTLSGDYLLDSRDPLFAQLATAFTKLLITEFGTDHVYNADTFNEMVPSSNDPAYLKTLGASLYASLAEADPDAVWMVQGWMFSYDANFWQPAQIQAYLSGIPPGKMIILDLNAFIDPIWNKTESFYGTDFVWCIIDNAGGRPGIYGDLERVTTAPPAATAASSSMVGVGIAPEGTMQNPVTFELLAEMGWRSQPVDLPTWIRAYVRRRYGPNAPQEAFDAWALLLPNVYNNMDQHFWAMYADVPSTNMGGYSSWTNSTAMIQVWRLLNAAAPAVGDVDPFLFDLVDVSRQAMGYIFEDLYVQLMAAYRLNDTVALRRIGAAMFTLVEDLDAVLATHPLWMVGTWLADARAWAADAAEADQLETSARLLITIWGPDGQLNGYATRELAGLNVDFHLPKWRAFVDALVASAEAGTAFPASFANTCFFNISRPWALAHNPYPAQPVNDTRAVVDAMFNKYAGPLDAHSLATKGYVIHPNSDGNGGVWGNLRMQLHDPAVGEFLCDVMPGCGGFVADGYYKPLYAPPVPYDGSTYYARATGPCDATTVCAAPVAGAAECNGRCDCFWDPAHDTCGCVGEANTPACQSHYPKPGNASVVALADPATSPLRADDRVTFLGDSITWLGGYMGQLGRALNASGSAALANVTLSNRGINGGTAKDILNGATLYGHTYPGFEAVMEADRPTVVTIFIGMNDVWFPTSTHHSDPEEFKSILTRLITSVRGAGATPVLFTLSVHGERTTGTQPFDANMTIYTEAIRDVAVTTGVQLGDMHKAYLAYERAYNTVPAGGVEAGVLTVAGVHPCLGGTPASPCPLDTHGNLLLADVMAGAISAALQARNTAAAANRKLL